MDPGSPSRVTLRSQKLLRACMYDPFVASTTLLGTQKIPSIDTGLATGAQDLHAKGTKYLHCT